MFRRSTIEGTFRTSLIVLILSELTSAIGPLADGIVIAAFLGEKGIAEFGIINPLLIAYSALGAVFSTGALTFCTRLIGKGRTEEARDAFSVGFFWIAILSAGLTAALLGFSDPIIRLLGASPESEEVFCESRHYFIGITVSVPAINLILYLTSFMHVDNDRRRALIATVALTVTDIAGDLLSATVLHAGMLGMGLATSAANYAALAVLLLHFMKRDALMKPRLGRLPWRLTGTILSNGAVSFATLTGNALMFILMNRILIRYAGEGILLIAFTAQRQVYNYLFSMAKAMGRSATSMAGFFYGERNARDLGDLLRLGLKYTALFIGGMALLVILLSRPIASLFVGAALQAVPPAARAIRIISVGVLFVTLNNLYEAFFRGGGRVKPSFLLSTSRDFMLPIIVVFALGPLLRGQAVFWAYTLAQILQVGACALAIGIRCLRKDRSLAEMALFLPDSFQIPPDRCLYRSVSDIRQSVGTSREIEDLCLRCGANPRKAMYAALCVEEMCNNIIEHGFAGRKQGMISVAVLVDPQTRITVSIRDDCRPFSPLEWEAIHHDEDPASNIGIRMTAALADEMRYVNIMNLNNLYVTYQGHAV